MVSKDLRRVQVKRRLSNAVQASKGKGDGGRSLFYEVAIKRCNDENKLIPNGDVNRAEIQRNIMVMQWSHNDTFICILI